MVMTARQGDGLNDDLIGAHRRMSRITLEEARAAKGRALSYFRDIGDVVGVGITRLNKEYAIKVNLRAPISPDISLPTHIEGVPVRVEVAGVLRPRRTASD